VKKRKMNIIAEALISAHPSLAEMLAYGAVGFVLVMFVLSVQTFLTWLLGLAFISHKARTDAAAQQSQPPSA